MCSLFSLSLPVNGYDLEKSTCLQPILQHTSTYVLLWKAFGDIEQSRCKFCDGTRQTEYQIPVREGRNDKSLHQNYRKPSHVCAIMPCTEGLFKARKFPSGCWHCMYGYTNYCIATQPADYNDYLISKLCVYHLKKIPDAPIIIK